VQLLYIQVCFISLFKVNAVKAVIRAPTQILFLSHLFSHLLKFELQSLFEIIFKFFLAVAASAQHAMWSLVQFFIGFFSHKLFLIIHYILIVYSLLAVLISLI
jgi:hypothetical protein